MTKDKKAKGSVPVLPKGLTKGQLTLYKRCQEALKEHLERSR